MNVYIRSLNEFGTYLTSCTGGLNEVRLVDGTVVNVDDADIDILYMIDVQYTEYTNWKNYKKEKLYKDWKEGRK